MIIYGTTGSRVRTEPAPGLSCPACANTEKVQLSVYSHYAHVYGIPLFPYSRSIVTQCQHCRNGWRGGELPGEAHQLRQAAQVLRRQVPPPWWQWSGLVLLAGLIGWLIVGSSLDDRDNISLLAAPRAGDVYTVRESDTAARYTLLKVVSAQGNTVDLIANDYELDSSHPLDALNYPEKYSKEPFTLTQLDLQIMKNKGQLTDVDRLGH